jgi:hypothetical protein
MIHCIAEYLALHATPDIRILSAILLAPFVVRITTIVREVPRQSDRSVYAGITID